MKKSKSSIEDRAALIAEREAVSERAGRRIPGTAVSAGSGTTVSRAVTTFRLPQDLSKWLHEHAFRTHQSKNAIVEAALREYRKSHEVES